MTKHAGTRMYQMQKNGELTDVSFMLQGCEIKGHRIVFISYGGLLQQLVEKNELDIKDVSPETFHSVLE